MKLFFINSDGPQTFSPYINNFVKAKYSSAIKAHGSTALSSHAWENQGCFLAQILFNILSVRTALLFRSKCKLNAGVPLVTAVMEALLISAAYLLSRRLSLRTYLTASKLITELVCHSLQLDFIRLFYH